MIKLSKLEIKRIHFWQIFFMNISSSVNQCICHVAIDTGFPTEEIIPRVESTLDSGDPVSPSQSRVPSLVVVFQCKFDEVSNYVYDVFWYINEYYVNEHNNILYSNIRKTDLRPEDWVGKHYMNMIVSQSSTI